MANIISNLYNKLTKTLPYEGGALEELGVENPNSIQNRFQNMDSNLANYLLGTPVQQNESVGTTTDDNGNVIQSANISNPLREGGVLRDIASGYRENRYNPLSLENFAPDKNKNWANRAGEAMGTLTRFGVSPAGRALATAGAIGLMGGDLDDALAYGVNTAAMNQKLRTQNQLYRDDLIQTQQNTLKNNPAFGTLSDTEKAQILSNLESANPKYKTLGADEQAKLLQNAQDEYLTNRQNDQLQNIADNINNRRGYITQDVYKNLVDTQQLRDNADWRRMYFDTQQKNLETQRDWQRQQYQMQQDEKRADRAFQYYNANLNHQDRLAALEAKKQEEQPMSVAEQLTALGDLFKDLPQNNAKPGTRKATSLLTAGKMAIGYGGMSATSYDAIADSLATVIARKNGEKGTLSDGDIKRYRKSLPEITDTPEQAQAKFDALHKVYGFPQINILPERTNGNVVNTQGKTTKGNTQTIGKYKVTVKG